VTSSKRASNPLRVASTYGLIFMLIYACSAHCEAPSKLALCDKALKSCEAYSEAASSYNTQLKQDEEDLASKLTQDENKLPVWFWLGVGFAAGGMTYGVLFRR
jgi:hypothetical protein